MLLFDGLAIFGNVRRCTTERVMARQITGYPGISGIDILNMGSRGRRTQIEGWHAAPGLFELGLIQDQVDAYVLEGLGHDFIDAKGRIFTGAVLEYFAPTGITYPDGASIGGFAQAYTARILHPR